MRFNKKQSEYRLFTVIVLLVGLAFPTFFSFAVDNTKGEKEETNVFTYTGKDGDVHELRYSSDETITAVGNKDGIQEVAKYNPKEGKIIVQLEDRPIIKYVKKGESLSPEFLTAITNRLQASHQQLKQDIADIEKRIGISPGETSTTIKREYYYVFNGLALSTDRKVIKEIKALPYVLEVYPDVEVKACLTESVPLINADDVWGMGYTGAGITVGIIDTGIDYNHPDLEDNYIGGYDFVNNDSDPMDDHFHGTHVAGIVAASGKVKLTGVAPDASLVAYKVLNFNGCGYTSDIVAAVDRACDPDQDPQTDDALDVINLSIGSVTPGDPDDPLCQAIDSASAAGVICVCAAGNDGPYYFTINSPGCAREAITVGAADKNSIIPIFSSKGPTNKIYSIKPDLVAPGVTIESTMPGGSYEKFSGTSAAAPHVAGAAALLRQRYPNYSPQDIKSILMGSAIDLGEGVFVQGTGMIDVYGAAWLRTIVSPASISLGWDDPEQPIFGKLETLKITNTGPIQRTYSASITLPMAPGGGYTQPGIAAEISPANFTLAPGQTRDLTFTIAVDNTLVPSGPEEPGSYEGKVVIQTPAKTIMVPFAFIKLPRLEIVLDEEPYYVVIHNRLDRTWEYFNPGTCLISKLLLEGIYDVMVFYWDSATSVVKEGINLLGNRIVYINKSDAVYTVDITKVDENGDIINPDNCYYIRQGFSHKPSGIYILLDGGQNTPCQYYHSPLSTDYAWEWSILFNDYITNKLYSFNGYSDGLDSDLTFENQPDDLKQVDYQYHVDPGVEEIWVKHYSAPINGDWLGYYGEDRLSTYTFTQTAYYMPIPYPNFNFGGHMQDVFKRENASRGDHLYRTPIFAVEDDPFLGIKCIKGYLLTDDSFTPIFQTTSGYLDIGLSTPYWFGEFNNVDECIVIRTPIGYMGWIYLTQTGDVRPQIYPDFQLYQNGEKKIEGHFSVDFSTGHPNQCIPLNDWGAGVYTLTVPYTYYYVKDIQGAALMSATFDTSAGDKNPPYMTHFNILCEGRPTNTVGFGKKASIKFKVYDDNGLSQVSLYYSTGGGWFPLTLTNSGNQYTALIPPFPVRTYVSLRLVANDTSGNNLTYDLNPAFFIKPTPLTLFQTAK